MLKNCKINLKRNNMEILINSIKEAVLEISKAL